MELKELIVNDLRVLRLIAEDIQDQNELTDTLTQPDLILESNEDLLVLIDEYNKISDKLEHKLKEYVDVCKTNKDPIDINLYKIYKNLKHGGNRCQVSHQGP